MNEKDFTTELEDLLVHLQEFQEAFERAMRVIALYGAHWNECETNNSFARPCTCGFFASRKELMLAVRR